MNYEEYLKYFANIEGKYGFTINEKKSKIDKISDVFYKFVAIYLLLKAPMIINGLRNRLVIDVNNKYTSIEQARSDLDIERKKLGLEKIKIDLYFVDREECTANAEGTLEKGIKIELGKYRNRQALRHELYHISKYLERDEKKEKERIIDRLLGFEEWGATSYAIKE
ncbi:MAG: hypothetical protein Q7S27_03845 [Nanoarchaeota archaeon]|nr:hypothetical protein [Nanoarchaeota archaeon]